MTALIGGSVLLVAASTVALVFGWSTADEGLIWTSIGASLAAAVLLVIAVVRGRKTVPEAATRATATTERAAASTPATAPSAGRAPDRGASAEPHPAGPETRAASAAVTRPQPVAAPAEPARKSPAPKSETATKPAATPAKASTTGKAGSTAAQNEVIAVPDRKRFHRASCRYASAKGAERMSKASARRRGYAACGVCKP